MPTIGLTTKRTLYFFKVKTESNTCLKDILHKVHHELWISDKYTDKDNGDEKIYLRNVAEINWYICWIISNLRLSKLPKKWKVGELDPSALALLDDEGIVESTHFIYVPSDKILVLEYNHFWPRNWIIEWHINNKIHQFASFWISEVVLQPILNEDTLDKLSSMWAIKSIAFSVPKNSTEVRANDASTFISMVQSAMNYGDTWEVSIEIKAWKHSSNPLLENALVLKSELEQMGVPLDTVFNEFKVRAIHRSLNKTKTFDLLQDKMKDIVSVVKLERERSVDSDDMYTQMQISYRDNRDTIMRLSTWE